MTDRKMDPEDEQIIGRLISSSGRGPTPSPDARNSVYAAVHAEWRRNFAHTEVGRNEAPVRRGWALADWLSIRLGAGLAVAAGVAIAVSMAVFLRAPTVGEPVALAALAKMVGSAEVVDELGRSMGASAGATIFAGQRLVTGAAAGAALELANGESVRLNAATELGFLSAGIIELRAGTIYVDSEGAGDGAVDTAVVVTTAHGDVRHIGTQYEVSVRPIDLRVRVREGAVAIVADRGDAGADELVGRAGEEILLPRAGQAVRTQIAPTDAAWAWAEALAALPEASEYQLTELLAWVARQTGRDVRFESDASAVAAEGLVLHGIAGLTPEETYDVITSTTGLDYRLTPESLIVN